MLFSMAEDVGPSVSKDTEWMVKAACRNQPIERFFDKVGIGRQTCKGCPVKAECLDYSLIHNEYGVWGGLTENQRTRRYPDHIRNAMREDYYITHHE